MLTFLKQMFASKKLFEIDYFKHQIEEFTLWRCFIPQNIAIYVNIDLKLNNVNLFTLDLKLQGTKT